MTPFEMIVSIVGALLAGIIIGDYIGWFRGRRFGKNIGLAIGRLEGYNTCKEDYKKAMDDVVYEQMCEIAANKGRERTEDGEDWKK